MKVYGITDLHIDVNPLRRDRIGKLDPYFNEHLLDGTHKDDILLIGGDTAEIRKFKPYHMVDGTDDGYLMKTMVMKGLEDICKAFKHVVMIMGNHEYYQDDLHTGFETLRDLTKHIDNLQLVNNQVVEVEGIKIIATILWTDLRGADPVVRLKVRRDIWDWTEIGKHEGGKWKRVDTMDTIKVHNQCRKFLIREVEAINPDDNTPVIVMTHHAMIMAHCNALYGGDLCDYAFACTGLDDFVLDNAHKVDVYFHGHTHDRKITEIDGAKMVTWARGYKEPFVDPMLLLDTEI
jgi:UDP-2,3-diacylglucosamine pyrophosphatase LpxH